MANADHERQLRRAVADLSQCSIEDIESVWAALSIDERERLKPLLAEASHIAPERTTGITPTDARSENADRTGLYDARTARQLAHAVGTLPNEIGVRLLHGLDTSLRTDVLAALPPERRTAFDAACVSQRMTPKAGAALREAALSAIDVDHVPARLPTSEPTSLRWKLRRWMGARS
ncbi:hypothetical protein [Burkholderia cepacia]|uniref:Uncharacterized protein n=1 Tax=Burkholderia cepacia TaxID=292 RepID=A0AA89CC61_BURCE|nr:hypothetical protein [Burkholderia cepacia]KGB98766.1 hypothetical protein DM43_3078 [Burkholderia cepacia]